MWNFGFRLFLGVVSLLCVCALPVKAVPEMTYIVLSGTLFSLSWKSA